MYIPESEVWLREVSSRMDAVLAQKCTLTSVLDSKILGEGWMALILTCELTVTVRL